MKGLSSFKTDHHYVSGLVLVTVGIFGIAGSITGSLAAMIAGLFCNSDGVNTALYTQVGASGNGGQAGATQSTQNGGTITQIPGFGTFINKAK